PKEFLESLMQRRITATSLLQIGRALLGGQASSLAKDRYLAIGGLVHGLPKATTCLERNQTANLRSSLLINPAVPVLIRVHLCSSVVRNSSFRAVPDSPSSTHHWLNRQ